MVNNTCQLKGEVLESLIAYEGVLPVPVDYSMTREKHWYVRQKSWEAVRCLVGTKLFRDRLIAAASPLSELKIMHPSLVEDLPEGVQNKFKDVMEALTRYQAEWKGDSVHAASVRKLTPRQRTKVAEYILDIYVAVSGGL